MARLTLDAVGQHWMPDNRLRVHQDNVLPLILWVHHWVIGYARTFINPNLKIGDQLTLVNQEGQEFIYILKKQDEETLE